MLKLSIRNLSSSFSGREELITLSFNSNAECFCFKKISNHRLDTLPCFDVMTSIDKNPNLRSIDIDLQLPIATNFKYYSAHDFHSSEDIQSSLTSKSFSALHHNIRSIGANFEFLHQLLADMNHSFSIIGLSETKIRQGKDQILNTDIIGSQFLSQPTLSEAGSSRWDGKYPGFSVSPKNQGRKFRICPKLHRFKLRLVCR